MCALHPHPSSVSFKCGGRRVAGPAPPLQALWWEGPHRPMPSSAVRASEQAGVGVGVSIVSAPTPRLSSTGTRLPSSPAPHLFLLPAPPLRPPPPPPQVPLGSRSTLSGSLRRFQRGCSPGPAPSSLLPSLHLAPETAKATGAVRRTLTPRPGYFPPPRSRENCAAASGSSREIHHHGSCCSRGSGRLSGRPGGGRCGGWKLRAAEAGARKWG